MPVLLFELGVRYGDPVGEHGLQPLHEQALTEALLELVRRDRRVLQAEPLPITGLTDELSVHVLEPG